MNANKKITQRCWVELSGFGDGVETFFLVDPPEADPVENRIANNCPLAQQLIGTPVGGGIEIDLPRGPINLTVVNCGDL